MKSNYCLFPNVENFGLLAGNYNEKKLSTGKNVALWKPTNQSSLYSSSYTSDKAVDGSGDGDLLRSKSCTHTKARQSIKPTWNVNLEKAYSIVAIKISNRNTNRKYVKTFIQYFTYK